MSNIEHRKLYLLSLAGQAMDDIDCALCKIDPAGWLQALHNDMVDRMQRNL